MRYVSATASVSAFAACCAGTLFCLSPHALAAEVTYEHPELTIVAKEEPLDTVLKSLGREMRIFITVPTGLNPEVSCNAQSQPVKQALKCLLGEMSYSLEWEAGGERLAGLTIFASNAQSAVNTNPARNTQYPARLGDAADQAAEPTGRAPVLPGSGGSVPAEVEADAMERALEMDMQRAEHEARMAEEREVHEAEMALRRQEEEIAQEERMREETARHEAEMRVYIESQGLKFPD